MNPKQVSLLKKDNSLLDLNGFIDAAKYLLNKNRSSQLREFLIQLHPGK